MIAQSRKDWDKALTWLDQADRVDPQNAFFLNTRTQILLQLNRFEEAAESSRRASELDPSDELLYKYAFCLYKLGSTEKATHVIWRLLQRGPHWEGT